MKQSQKPENNTDFSTVSILFEDRVITHLFSELLKVRGVETKIISDISQVTGETRIITEPQYFPEIPNELQNKCLIVGDKEAVKELPTASLERPLTEDKIENALLDFLKQ